MKRLDAEWKVIIIVAAILTAQIMGIMFLIASVKNNPHDYYAKSALVIDLNTAEDVVTVEDGQGFIWEFSGCEDWEIGDGCAMVMNTNGTDKIFDDEIINVKYEKK